jgi:hypothetical protein
MREVSAADLRECCQRVCHGHALGHRSEKQLCSLTIVQ